MRCVAGCAARGPNRRSLAPQQLAMSLAATLEGWTVALHLTMLLQSLAGSRLC